MAIRSFFTIRIYFVKIDIIENIPVYNYVKFVIKNTIIDFLVVLLNLQYGGARFKQRLDMIKWALCVPASCTASDVQTYLKSYVKENALDVIENVSVADNMCTRAQRPGDEYTVYDITFV